MNIVNKMLYFVLKLKKQMIQFPSNLEKLESVSKSFPNYPGNNLYLGSVISHNQDLLIFLGAVGAIDGSHTYIYKSPYKTTRQLYPSLQEEVN